MPADWFGESQMTATSFLDRAVDGPRPRPNPGYRVAPPVGDAYAPWVSALDDQLAAGRYEWVMIADALVPVAVAPATDDARARPRRLRWLRWTRRWR